MKTGKLWDCDVIGHQYYRLKFCHVIKARHELYTRKNKIDTRENLFSRSMVAFNCIDPETFLIAALISVSFSEEKISPMLRY